ncbi:MAG TPA: hypothetical protein VH143_05605 [Kofleriaceae bacterium]|nr:hypothetical protein [Kofleriaceae bacterium]
MNWRLASVIALGLAACSNNAKQPMTLEQMIAADPLPLAPGAKWTYDVTVKRYDPETEKEITKTLTWTTEVLDQHQGNGVTAYRVRGWPSDLASIDDTTPTPTPTERTLLRSGNSFLFGSTPEPTIDGAEGWFSWPVIDGQRICPRKENVYCWEVQSIDGGYALKYYTGPDEQTFDLQPGTGVSRFHYMHHGTTNEVDARLTSYTKGH